MSKFDFTAESSPLKTFDGLIFDGNFYCPDCFFLSEQNCVEFFDYCRKINCSLVIFPIEAQCILTEEDEVFNEQFLAVLRKVFKSAQDYDIQISIKPVYKNIDYERLTACMKHCARRLKNCEQLTGFTLPENDEFKSEKVRNYFIGELSEKHPHYKFFILCM
ncbi:MAG: hypothetical protein ACTTHG_01945 [Treponemataceae bacterium]